MTSQSTGGFGQEAFYRMLLAASQAEPGSVQAAEALLLVDLQSLGNRITTPEIDVYHSKGETSSLS